MTLLRVKVSIRMGLGLLLRVRVWATDTFSSKRNNLVKISIKTKVLKPNRVLKSKKA